MNIIKFHLFILLFLIVLFPVSAQDSNGKITAETLNVRVSPDTVQSVVARLKRDDIVRIVSSKEGWIEIAAPSDSLVWVAKSAVAGTEIIKDTFYRSGAGITYSPYGQKARKGTKIDKLEERKDWFRISPPEGLTAWVSTDYVLTDGDMVKSAEKKKSGKSGVDKSSKGIPQNEKLSFTSIAAEQASYEGFLIPLAEDAVYVTHTIAVKVNDVYSPICYVRSEKIKLNLWENQKIQVSGKERWVQGWKRPVMDVDMINPIGGQ